jgi:hypothetical protein
LFFVILAALAFLAFHVHSASSLAAPAKAREDEIDALLRLLGQNVRIGLVEVGRPIDPVWLKDLRKLQSSAKPAVAKTARAAEDSAKQREDALKVLQSAEAKNEKLRAQMKDFAGDGFSMFDSVSDSEIDAARRNGQITANEAEAYGMRNAARERALLELGSLGLQIYANTYLADNTVRAMRKKAEVLEADAVAELLVVALRARAGAKRDNPPLRIVAGMAGTNQDNVCVLPSILSTASTPLTRLTVLMEIRAPFGRRRAVAFIPKLEPGRGVQIAPVPYNVSIVSRSRDDASADKAGVIRYSIWCDQFSYEGPEGPLNSSKDAKVAYCSLAAEQGRRYDFDERRRGRDRTIYRLEFTELTANENVFRVKGNLSLFDSLNRDKPLKVTPFEGDFHSVDLAPAADKTPMKRPAPDPSRKTPNVFDQARKGHKSPETPAREPASTSERRKTGVPAPPADAMLTISSGSEQSEIDLYVGEDGSIGWAPATGLLRDRMVRSTEQIMAARAEAGVMVEANRLAMAGNKEEAARLLKDYIATDPGQERVAEAERKLKQLDSLTTQGARLDEFIEARRKDPKPASAMGDFGKGLPGFDGLRPPGGRFGTGGNAGTPAEGELNTPKRGRTNPARSRNGQLPQPPSPNRP